MLHVWGVAFSQKGAASAFVALDVKIVSSLSLCAVSNRWRPRRRFEESHVLVQAVYLGSKRQEGLV